MFSVVFGSGGSFIGRGTVAFPVADKEQEVGGFQLTAGHVDITEYFTGDAFLLASGVDRKLGALLLMTR